MMTEPLHVGLMLIVAGLLLPLIPRICRPIWVLGIPWLALALMFFLPAGNAGFGQLLGYPLQLVVLDSTSRLFGIVFCFALCAGNLYCFAQAKIQELSTAFIYAGSALGVVLAGDLLSLFIFWEIMAFASLCLIWFQGSAAARRAGMRYILIHLLGGVILLIGIISHVNATGSTQLEAMTLQAPGSWWILCGILLNAGAPPFCAWLADAYPEASPGGMVFLSAFTTKAAVYVLLRGFPGSEILIWIGMYMIFYGIIYALLENDMRRILAYSIVNQVGFMVCGVGIGSALALNGVAAHAFTHIIYKALLIMSAGSVLYMTGRHKCTDLGGLIYSMRLTAAFGIIGALAISAFPLTSGFISKSMITQATAVDHLLWIWLLLQAASAGVFLHAGIKFPWFVFLQKDAGLRPPDPPWNMCLAMGILAFFCVFIGIYPGLLYQWLPYPVDYVPYTSAHVLTQLQLLLFGGVAFFVMLPWMQRTLTISLDVDWLYRRLLMRCVQFLQLGIIGGGNSYMARQRCVGRTLMSWMSIVPFDRRLSSVLLLLTLGLFAMVLAWYLWI